MPELPEVETIARKLRPGLLEQEIVSARVLWPRTVATPAPAEFPAQAKGKRIEAVTRRAKYLWLQLSDSHNLFFHLRMSGDLWIESPAYQPAKHDRLLLELSDGNWLVFNDTRKFGRAWLTTDPQTVIGHLGPEPLEPGFSPEILRECLSPRRRALKPTLLDQSVLAGLGNIYTDEALHLSRLHPLRRADSLTQFESENLYHAIQTVLRAGIEHNGASIDWVYRGGNFQNHFHVYDRAGKPCATCGAIIQKITVGQRGTHFCPNCQEAM